MPIESDKPIKKCRYCNKEVVNLGLHIANVHPKILDQIEELDANSPQNIVSLPLNTPISSNLRQSNDINSMIREKLDTMLNIKIIEMLSKNPDVSIKDIQTALQPPQNTQLSDVIALHNAIYPKEDTKAEINIGGESGGWLELANNALPLINRMLPQKQAEIQKNDTEYRKPQERNIGIRRLIPGETPRDPGKPSNIGGESSVINGTKQQDSGIDNAIDKRS